MILESQLRALLPIIVLAAASAVVMMGIAFRRDHRLIFWLTLLGLLATLGVIPVASSMAPIAVTELIRVDAYALFFTALTSAAGFAVAVLARDYLEVRRDQPEEFYLLVLTALLGAAVLAASSHFASFLLGLETISISLFPLIAYSRHDKRALEAAIKYLVLSGVASGLLLFGMALIYAETGILSFDAMAAPAMTFQMITGTVLIIVALGFKLSLVPFHLWTADVYQGAPAPVTALLATVSKGAMLAVLLRYGVGGGLLRFPMMLTVLSVLAGASMLVGNLLALRQNNLKRILAYSSISHMGYLMVAVIATDQIGVSLASEALLFYLVAYFATVLAAFGVITVLSPEDREAEALDDYTGLFWSHPRAAVILTVSLLSLAGIPLTAGFIGKFYIFAAGGQASLWLLLALVIVGSGIGLYYYLRVVYQMSRMPASTVALSGNRAAALDVQLLLGVLGLVMLGLGVLPSGLIEVLVPLGGSMH